MKNIILKNNLTIMFSFVIFLFLLNFTAAETIGEDIHLNIQTLYDNGTVRTGTFDFVFNISNSTNCSDYDAIIYSNSTALTTDSRGIISYYLPNVSLNYDVQYYLCYYRNGSLINDSKIARTPYTFRAQNITLSGVEVDTNFNATGYNVTADTGFFNFLGSWVNKITTLFTQNIHFNGTINGSGNITTIGKIGIGTENPTEALEVAGNILATGAFETTGNDIIYAGSTLGQVRFFRPATTDDIALYAGGMERVRINGTNGYFGLNTTNPQNMLNVVGDGNFTGNLINGILSAAGCDVKAYTNGTLYCGTDETGVGGGITGLGTFGYIPIWNGTLSINDSIIFQNGDVIFVNGTLNASRILVNNTTVMRIDQWNATNTSYALNQTFTDIWSDIINVNYNATGLIRDWNISGWIRNQTTAETNWNASGYIRDWSGASETDPMWTANITNYFTKAQWNATNSSYLMVDRFNVTNASYLTDYGDTATGNYTFDLGTLFIDSSNDMVGIGITTPQRALHIYSSNYAYVHATTSGTGSGALDGVSFGYNNDEPEAFFRNRENSRFTIWTNNLVRQTITATGNVGINTTNPQNMLNVVGDINFTGLIYGNGSQLTGISLTETDPKWTANITNYFTKAQWNVTNTTYLRKDQWNATNTTYRTLTNGTYIGNWNVTGNLISGILTAASCDVKSYTNGTLYCGTDATGAAGSVDGLGTAGYIPVWNGTSSINNSIIYQNGTVINIASTGGYSKLNVGGAGSQETGIYGNGTSYGMYGYSAGSTGVYGYGSTYGIHGNSPGSTGVIGAGATGVQGNGDSYGVSGSSSGGVGVYGSSSSDTGVYGSGGTYGVSGSSSGTAGVTGSGGTYGVYGSGTYGVYGSGTSGVFGSGITGTTGVGSYTGVDGLGDVYGVTAAGGAGNFDFYAQGAGTNYGPFTGGHEVKFNDNFPINVKPGIIVSVTGEIQARKDNNSISLSSTLPTVQLSNLENDARVFGVLVSETPLPKNHWYKSKEDERFGVVNALGEGRVLVTNINGDISAGDYITTSKISGYGQKQNDDLLHSYTLGKATENIDWSKVKDTIEYGGKTYKAYLIGVVYTSG